MNVQRLKFCSPEPGAARLGRWWEEFRASLGGLEMTADLGLTVLTNVEYLPLGAFGVGRAAGSINRVRRSLKRAAADDDDRFYLVINRGRSRDSAASSSWQAVIPPGSALLFDLTEGFDHVCPAGHTVNAVSLSRRLFRQALPNAEDCAGVVIPADNQALRLLVHYADGLLGGESLSHPAVLAQAGQNLMDLAVLAFGTDRDNGETARLRGLRAVKLDAVLRLIRAGYDDPKISPAGVAARIGISSRYLHKLLHDTGSSFSERVQELRLAKAFGLLCGQGTACKVSEAAYTAGFNDLSSFNRMFRRKYGLTPTAARGRRDNALD